MQYPHLFQLGRIGRLQIRNRIVMPAMGTNFTGLDGVVSDRNVQYYAERARGGAGLIITEASYIDRTTKSRPRALGSVFRLGAIDNVVVAVGSQPNRLSDRRCDPGVVWKSIGDSEKPRDLLACISEAAEVAMAL